MAVFSTEERERRRVVPGFGGRYEVTSLGGVLSDGHSLSVVDGRFVNLCHGGVAERRDVAYLVARAFVPNAEGRPYVVHVNGDRRDNRASNLEWSETPEPRRRSRTEARSRTVRQYDREGILVARYASVAEAVEGSGLSRSLIRNCLDGRSRTAGGWIFRYE